MTTANLMNISSVNGKVVSQVGASKKLQEELEVAEAFAGYMNQAMFASNQSMGEVSSEVDFAISKTESAATSYERYSYKDNQIDSAGEKIAVENSEEIASDLEAAEQEIVEKICDVYGVSEEQVQDLLESMGLNVLDLLNPENLVNFVVQLTGVASSEELLLDEGFLTIKASMDSLAEGLMKDLDVDFEGLQKLVSQMEVVNEPVELPEDVQQLVEELPVQEITVVEENLSSVSVETDGVIENAEQVVENTEKIVATTEDDVEIQAEVKTQNEMEDAQNVERDSTVTEVVEKTKGQESFTSNQNAEGNSFLNQNTETVVLNQTNVSASGVSDMTQTQFASYMSTDSMQIMEQIVQQMKVTVLETTTSMEMQLNPENLGKVYVNISSEEGVVNAQFHATNEVVKEALEAQIATLRENLNQAGIKVDAIEVTIASHEFERNLEQNQQNPEETADVQEKQTNKRRNISVDALDELSGVMTEEETLVAQIMKDNGNSVDFTA